MDLKELLVELLEKVKAGEDLSWRDFWPISYDEPAIYARMAYYDDLTAAQSLHEAVTPEWQWNIEQMGSIGYATLITKTGEIELVNGESETASRAWLIAIIKVRIREES